MKDHVFVGFGFGPIQSGLFVSEAFNSGNFKRIVIAEIDQKLVDAVRANNGTYFVNVAASDSIITERIEGVEIYNPTVDEDRQKLLDALSQATEIVTSLPSVKFYDMGDASVAKLITAGLKNNTGPGTIIYTAENNNHAAEILEEIIVEKDPTVKQRNVQFINTVIGKMSQVVTDPSEIKEKNIAALATGIDRAFLVEQFNKILVTKCNIPGFKPGIEVFLEKEDLLPFEEAKLYGHNAIHALLAYLGTAKGYKTMAQLKNDAELMQIARDAFINDSGAALIKKYASLNDELFTEAGFKLYADDLLERMTNPYLDDAVMRAARDPFRKLGLNDRLFGTMKLCLEQGVKPGAIALGAAAGVRYLLKEQQASYEDVESILLNLWDVQKNEIVQQLIDIVKQADEKLN
jgi:mannitol-1-phosphate 5-dehydrogenase